jgi:hypothetical protein
VVIDLGRADPLEPGPPRQAGDRHADVGGVVEQDRGGVGVLADLLAQGGHGPVQGAGGEADGDLAVVPDPGRDGIPGGSLSQEHDLDGDVAALSHQLLDQPRQLGHDRVVGLDLRAGALALMEEGVRLVDHDQDQRPARGRSHMPNVSHAQDRGDTGLAVEHQPMDLPQHGPHVL